MSDTVSAEALYEGSWYALQQAGRLLQSASVVFDSGDPPTALAIAMFGREELGRSRLLRQCALQVDGGKHLTAAQVQKRCDDHVDKQEASNFSTMLRPSGAVAEAARTYATSTVGSDEWHKARSVVDAAVQAKHRRQPQDRHDDRCRGLYVDLNSDGKTWSRPIGFDRSQVLHEINEAVGNYSQERENLMNADLAPLLRDRPHLAIDQMTSARKRLTDLEIPPPVWPQNQTA